MLVLSSKFLPLSWFCQAVFWGKVEICQASRLTSNLRGIHNAWHFWFESALVFTAQCFRCGWLRCSPLNWALCSDFDGICCAMIRKTYDRLFSKLKTYRVR
ncbi:hypothetical protein CGJ62_07605 [Vibrio parahaemolyticus]|nr:hypothetical protein CGJ62_07605 [Vibrio parahaemolyticus]